MNESIAPHQHQANVKLPVGLSDLWQVVDRAARRTLDILISGLGILLLLPGFLILAFLIKRDSPGPIYYWGNRVGRNGRPFRILKFRPPTPEPGQGDG